MTGPRKGQKERKGGKDRGKKRMEALVQRRGEDTSDYFCGNQAGVSSPNQEGKECGGVKGQLL